MKHELREQERALIERLLKLANKRDPEAMEKAYATEAVVEETLEGFGFFNFWEAVRDWLTVIATAEKTRAGEQKRRTVAQQLNAVAQVGVTLTPVLRKTSKKGVLQVKYEETKSLTHAIVLPMMLLLDDGVGLWHRLSKCGNPKCGKFVLDLNPRGRPKRHCNASCKKAYDESMNTVRVQDYRKKKAKTHQSENRSK